MNKIYKTVFNETTGQMVAVQETASSHGQGGTTVTSRDATQDAPQEDTSQRGISLRPLQKALWAAFVMAPLAWSPAPMAAPVGANVQQGAASVTQSGLATTIRNSAGAVINWQSFNIAPNELVQFIQQNANSAVLNRVVGSGGSELLGMLQSNGRVFLINGNHDSTATRLLPWAVVIKETIWNFNHYCIHDPARVPKDLKSQTIL